MARSFWGPVKPIDTAGAVADAEWQGLCRAVNRVNWLEDERFATAAGRVAYAGERLTALQDVLRERPSAYWLERLEREDVPCAPVLDRDGLLTHPQILANHLVVELVFYTALAYAMSSRAVSARYLRAKVLLDRVAAAVLGALGLRLFFIR